MSSTATQKKLPRYAILHDESAIQRAAQTTLSGVYDLDPSEVQWRERQPTLETRGYALRKRYRPEWTPSWIGTNLKPLFCEDSVILAVSTRFPDLAISHDPIVVRNPTLSTLGD